MNKLNLDDLPLLKDYSQRKSRLSVRLTSPDRVKPDAVFKPFLDLAVTCHIDLSELLLRLSPSRWTASESMAA